MAVVLKLDYVRGLRRLAARGTYDGTPRTWPYAERCIAVHRGIEFWTKLMFTRDDGLHSSGWWKNPDYEHCCTTCQHLSREAPTSGHVGRCEWAALPAWLMRSLEWRYRRDRDVYNGWESCATWEPRENADG